MSEAASPQVRPEARCFAAAPWGGIAPSTEEELMHGLVTHLICMADALRTFGPSMSGADFREWLFELFNPRYGC